MTFPANQKIVLDFETINQYVFSLAAELASDEAFARILPELNVSTTASNGWQVADVLDYDCRYESGNRRRVIIRVVDAARTQEEIKVAKLTANPVVKRALNAFSRDIKKAIETYEVSRVTIKADEMFRVFNSGLDTSSIGYSHNFAGLCNLYNDLVGLDVSTDRNIVSNDAEKVLIRNSDDHTFATLRPRFWRNPANRQITTLYQPKVDIGSYSLRGLFRTLSRENESLLTANEGRYGGEILDCIELGLWATREILINFKQIGLKALGNEITSRAERLAAFIGPFTLSTEGGESIVINPAVVQAA